MNYIYILLIIINSNSNLYMVCTLPNGNILYLNLQQDHYLVLFRLRIKIYKYTNIELVQVH
jgi:hypothetical protein